MKTREYLDYYSKNKIIPANDLSDLRKSVEYSKQRVEYLEKTLKNIQDRNWNIKNAIEWRKFKEGAN